MILVDTSAWIEWLIDSGVAARLERVLPDRSEWLVPTIVQFELAKWLTREAGELVADQVVTFSQDCIVVSLDTTLALAAATVSANHKLAMADAVIYATARAHNATLLTCDAHFETLSGVQFVSKT